MIENNFSTKSKTAVQEATAQSEIIINNVSYSTESLISSYSSIYNKYTKRIIGLVLSLIAIIILSPLLIFISIAVAMETGFPVFYHAERGGYKGKTFKIFKFRSMVKNADKIGGGTTALNDSRITRVGNVLRKTKLDETAQLFNIVKGEMSFVGPRPELIQYTSNYSEIEKNILNVRPGLTDYSSLKFINLDEIVGGKNVDEMFEKYVLKEKNYLRLKYVAYVSFKTDVRLFFETVCMVIKKAFRVLFQRNKKTNK
ncbi:MAG: sugar transferase [Bacillota bacterium]|nr:sugar transferase [Bacillota bacterium]